MKPFGLRPFAWTFAMVRSRGRSREVFVDRIVRRARGNERVAMCSEVEGACLEICGCFDGARIGNAEECEDAHEDIVDETVRLALLRASVPRVASRIPLWKSSAYALAARSQVQA